MAMGDVVNGMTLVVGGGTLDFQPAAGVEVMITHGFSSSMVEGLPGVELGLYDGTYYTKLLAYLSPGTTPTVFTNMRPQVQPLRLFINNTRYLRMYNLDTDTTIYMGYCGIQNK